MVPKKQKLTRKDFLLKYSEYEAENYYESLNKKFKDDELTSMQPLEFLFKESDFETVHGKTNRYMFYFTGDDVKLSLLSSSKILWSLSDFIEKGQNVEVYKDKSGWKILPIN